MSHRRLQFGPTPRERERRYEARLRRLPEHLQARARTLPQREWPMLVLRDGLERLRDEQASEVEAEHARLEAAVAEAHERSGPQIDWPVALGGLSEEACAVLAVLRGMGDIVAANDLARRFSDAEVLDRGLGELCRAGLVEVKTTTGPDGEPAREGVLRLRYDVDFPTPPREA